MKYNENSTIIKVNTLDNLREFMVQDCKCSSIDWGDGETDIIDDNYDYTLNEYDEKCVYYHYKNNGEYIIEFNDCEYFTIVGDYIITEIIQIGKLHIDISGFCYCYAINKINLIIPDTVESMDWFGNYFTNLVTVNLVFGKGVKKCYRLLGDCSNLEEVNITFKSLPEEYNFFFHRNKIVPILSFDESLDKDEVMEFTKKVVSEF